MNFMKIFISAYTRIVLGITCLTTLAWFMWPESEFKIQAEPLSALVIAILTWLGSEISAQVLNSSLSQHDTNLLEKLDRIISDDFRSFIKVHDFGAPFAHSSIYPISKLADDWTGSRNEFVDKELGDKFKKILDLSHQIRSTILSQAGPAAKNTNILTFKPDNINEETRKYYKMAYQKANAEAAELCMAIDSFDEVARHKTRYRA